MKARIAFGAGLVILTIACGGDSVGIGRPGDTGATGATSGGPVASELVGSWRHALFFVDDAGIYRSSETTWWFGGDGVAVRTVVARNYTDGIADATTVVARWRIEGGTVVITFPAPNAGTARLDYRLEGNTLYLGSQPYLRT